jgi:hypothetical protein
LQGKLGPRAADCNLAARGSFEIRDVSTDEVRQEMDLESLSPHVASQTAEGRCGRTSTNAGSRGGCEPESQAILAGADALPNSIFVFDVIARRDLEGLGTPKASS